MSGDITKLVARIGDQPDAPVKQFHGRAAWALGELIAAGSVGITSLNNPAPRLAHYIFLLRRAGVGIATEHENHEGPFAGHHGKYKLTVPVVVIESERAEAGT